MKVQLRGLPTRPPSLLTGTEPPPPPRDPVPRERMLDRKPFGMPWSAPTWLIGFWTALIAIIGFAACTDPANGPTLGFSLLLLAATWCVGMVPLTLLWVAAWFRRRRDGAPR